MAFQRPFLISLRRDDCSVPWGFRLVGGSDAQPQHYVQQVLEGSQAERSGLREGDEIIQIGRINIQSLPHQDVQEVIIRCKDRVEMFIVREDLLRSKKENEPPVLKAVTHSKYNSPLQLYSSENVADTLAQQTHVLTDPGSPYDLGPSSPQVSLRSDVLRVVKEQEGQSYINGDISYVTTTKKQAPTPPPKRAVRAQESSRTDQNQAQKRYVSRADSQHSYIKENDQKDFKQEVVYSPSQNYSRKVQDEYQNAINQQNQYLNTLSQRQPLQSTENYRPEVQEQQYKTDITFQPISPRAQPRQQNINYQQNNNYQQNLGSKQESIEYQEQSHHYQQQQLQESQQRFKNQQQSSNQFYQQPYQRQYQPNTAAQGLNYQPESPSGTRNYRTKASFEEYVGSNTQANMKPLTSTSRITPSPVGSPSTQRRNQGPPLWPPKNSSVRDVPKTGFSPGYLDKGSKKFTWPPQNSHEHSNGLGRPPTPTGQVANAWHPSESPPPRSLPFAQSPTPTRRNKDLVWPPPHTVHQVSPKPSPRLIRRGTGRFDDYVQHHASVNIPPTYRTPPGTQHVEVVYED